MSTSADQAGESEHEVRESLGGDTLIGKTINNRFEVLSFIAKGGMGSVFKGRQLPLGRLCAIKVLLPSLPAEKVDDFHRRFLLEASTAAKLTHPNTVTIYDYGQTSDDVYYMAMEFLDGRTLRTAILNEAPFAEVRACHIASQICRSLREAHAMSVIHRDLKPANIFLVAHGDEQDAVKVLDFGLVKNFAESVDDQHTQAGVCMGSPKYMAPEQITGAPVDARTDIYALGILLYEMLTGRVPFDRGNGMSTIMAHVRDEVPYLSAVRPDLEISSDIERIVMRCLSKSPEKRFRSMDELLNALKFVMNALSTTSNEYPRGSGEGFVPVDPALTTASLRVVATQNNIASTKPSRAPNRSTMLVFGLATALVLLLVGVATRSSTKPAEASAPSPTATPLLGATIAATASAEAVAMPATPPPTVAPERRSTLHVETEPTGAAVKENGVEVCAKTPCDIRYEGNDARAFTEHSLLVALSGYKTETKVVRADEGDVRLALTRALVADVPALPVGKPKREDEKGGYKVDVPY
jgi:eukaryotic-like serine/threonine-protein kinase